MAKGSQAAAKLEVERAPLVLGTNDIGDVTRAAAGVVARKTPATWVLLLGAAASVLLLLVASLSDLVGRGIGEWGLNHPVGWAWDITGFVFWIGIGHAGTLISAILFLFRQKWRASLNRAADAMTLFAVVAGMI